MSQKRSSGVSMSFKRALLFSGSSSALVPLFGLLTAPLLSHALGVDGRGEVSAALAPALLLGGLSALGMPEALTYFQASRRIGTRRLLTLGLLFSICATALGIALVAAFARVLSGGDARLTWLILLSAVLAGPGVVVSVVRGLAIGLGQWHLVTAERLINAILRLAVLAILFVSSNLSVLNAILLLSIAPIVAGGVYFRLIGHGARSQDVIERQRHTEATTREFLRYGIATWLGTAAVVLLARMSQLVVTPLSTVGQLGLLAVAITVADVPFLLATAVRDAAFGVFSSGADVRRIFLVNRMTLLITVGVSLILGSTLPLWVGFAFGGGFTPAVLPTWITLASQIVSVPYLILGAGLAASGKPLVRSLAIVGSLLLNVLLLFLLVPTFGAVGAALAGVAGNVAAVTFVVARARKTYGSTVAELTVPRLGDARILWEGVASLLRTRRG